MNRVRVKKQDVEVKGNPQAESNEGPAEPAQGERAPGAREVPPEEMTKEELVEKVKEASDTAKKNYELYLRSQAEMENLKKRNLREREALSKYANETLLKQLLPVLDNLEKALEHSADEESLEALREGVALTLKGMMDTLQKAGVKKIHAKGEAFDPNFHEAVTEQEDERAEPGSVLQVFQEGYTLNERLIRPAMVSVCKRKDENEQ